MNHYLILRLTNAAIDCDRRGQGNLAALLTEAINELSKPTKAQEDTKHMRNLWDEL